MTTNRASNTSVQVSPEDVPLPTSTDSMITVRLSDAQLRLEEDESTPLETSTQVSVTSPSRPASQSSLRSSCGIESPASTSTGSVDWKILEETEEQEPKDEGTDESTALLLARLENENAALATNPKAGMSQPHRRARPVSIQQLKRMVSGPHRQSLRYSLVPAPQMTELEFWAALVQDYPQTVERLPTLTSNKIRGGVPPPLRGVVWPSIAGANDGFLHTQYQKLSQEPSPYDALIGKDVGRSFPGVEMFREKGGEGQAMLGRVLKAFSLYDDKIGYCQGLGFVVGPLLMHMGEAEAFCVLVRLMEHYDLRSCYLPDLSGLHLRIFQYQTLLNKHLPELSTHLTQLKIEPLYVSQWFLSFFAVTCPLPMLLRIYDVILSEGATETLMRVALSLMQRNQKKLMAFSEFEDVMQFLLSRSLWDTYAQHADDLVADFVSLTSLVTQDSLQSLESSFRQSQSFTATSALKNAASSLLGRFWTGSSHTPSKSGSLSLLIPGSKAVRNSTSGHSLTSTVTSVETSASDASTLATELSEMQSLKTENTVASSAESVISASDRDFHQQIEDLLTALSKSQHEQVELTRQLQREREQRQEDAEMARKLLVQLKTQHETLKEIAEDDKDDEDDEVTQLLDEAESHYNFNGTKRMSIHQTKHQLRDVATEWKEKHASELARCQELMKQLDEREVEHKSLKEELREARKRFQDTQKDKQRLERTVQDLRSRGSTPDSPDTFTPVIEYKEFKLPPIKPGLREFKLGKADSGRANSIATPTFSKRTSSLNPMDALTSDAHQIPANDALLLELVNAKTAEAIARQELEETRGKLDALRKILAGPTTTPLARTPSSAMETSTSVVGLFPLLGATSPKEPNKSTHTASASTGGFFSGWGKRGT